MATASDDHSVRIWAAKDFQTTPVKTASSDAKTTTSCVHPEKHEA